MDEGQEGVRLAGDPIKVYDARWIEDEFSDAEVRRLFLATLAYARELNVDTVCLTRDARLAGGRVMEIAVDAALEQGFRVFLRAEPVSTPQGYFTAMYLTRQHFRTLGLSITASHNPANYVGVKFVVPSVAAIGLGCGPNGGLTRVREIYHSERHFEPRDGGTLSLLDLSEDYIDYALQTAALDKGQLAGLSVVLDAFHGSAGPEIVLALQRAGARVHARRLIPDGRFRTGSPNPTSLGKMDDAVALAKQLDADAVIGVDGDGDRIVFGSQRGILTAGFAFIPILKACGLTPGNPQPVLYDPKVSPLALAEWGRQGAQCTLFRNGHSQIKDYMTQVDALAAAEESGHYYHRLTLGDVTVSGEHSLLTILLLLRSLKDDPQLMHRLHDMQDQIYTTGEFNYQFADDSARDAALAVVVEHFAGQGAQVQTQTPGGIDLQGTCLMKGVALSPGTVQLDEGWFSGYIRVSNTEPGVVRSYFSAADEESGAEIERQARGILGERLGGQVVE